MLNSLAILFPATLASIWSILVYLKIAQRRQHLTKQLQGIKINNLLKQLLNSTQQHRGMASAYLNGDASFRYKLAALQAEITRLFDELKQRARDLQGYRKQLNEIRSAWETLSPNVFSMTKQKSFTLHCALVALILNLIRDIAEQNHLHQESICSSDLAEILWYLLPDTAEAIGQARAIGTGMAASGLSPVTERIKLGFLMTRIRQRLERVDRGMTDHHGKQELLTLLQPNYQQIRGNLDKLIEDVHKQLLSSEQPRIDSVTFFNTATETLNSVFSVFDYGEQLTRDHLQKRMRQVESASGYSTAVLVLSLATSVCMFAWVN